jgi:hypothetical protein
MFEKASRLKVRFESEKGYLAVEDLWDLSLIQLNKLAKKYNKEMKENEEEDFLKVRTAKDTLTELKFNLILHVLTVKKEEQESKEKAAEKKAQKEKLLTILERKESQELEGKSVEELKKQIAELE